MRSRRGFTLIELLVVIAIIAILAAILLPVFARARENARKSTCLSNCKQQGNAFMMYAQDYDERVPSWDWGYWNKGLGYFLAPYTKSQNVWHCPSDSVHDPVIVADYTNQSYGYNIRQWVRNPGDNNNSRGKPLAEIQAPASVVATMGAWGKPSWGGWGAYIIDHVQLGDAGSPATRIEGSVAPGCEKPTMYGHMEGGVFVFGDGHAKWLPTGKIMDEMQKDNANPRVSNMFLE